MIFFRKIKIKKATRRIAEVLFKEAWEIMDNNPGYVIDDAVRDLYKKYAPKEVQESQGFKIPSESWNALFLIITWQMVRKELGLGPYAHAKKDLDTAAHAVNKYFDWRMQNPPGWMKI